jgi:hypothetical protein
MKIGMIACLVGILFLAISGVRSTFRQPTRFNIWSLFIAAVVGGIGTGFGLGFSVAVPHLVQTINEKMTSLENEGLLAATVSTGALHRLEEGKIDGAKTLLAENVAGFYERVKNAKHPMIKRDELLASIEAAAAKSEILRKEIALQSNPAGATSP